MTNHLDPLPEKLVPICPPEEAYQAFSIFYQDLLDLKAKNQISEWGLRKTLSDICKHLGYHPEDLLALNATLYAQFQAEKAIRKSGF